MTNRRNHITVFEHQILKVGEQNGECTFIQHHLDNLVRFFGEKGVPYFKLINKGVQFNQFVGVIKIGQLTIEILPKADKEPNDEDKEVWLKNLIGMLRTVGIFNVTAPSSSSLKIKSNCILDLYFELFIKEVEYLFNKGLIKKYRKTQGNSFALKGNILFGKHIQQNLVHQERFYIKHSTYDKEHLLHQILLQTLQLLQIVNTNVTLNSRIGNLLLNFPEMIDIKISELLFNKVVFNRKTEEYKNAIEISKLLLLNYHPDLSNGHNHILALMFDMNKLWEKFIYVSLRKHLEKDMTITAQTSKYFWKPETGYNSKMRPDIVITKGTEDKKTFVIDTKWKNIGDNNPSPDDLRQLYVYHHYYQAEKVALVYPGQSEIKKGNYFEIDNEKISKKECNVIPISTNKLISDWQAEMINKIRKLWL